MDTVIRAATINDLDACRRMDGSVVSAEVWNMQLNAQRTDIALLFSQVRLPRPLAVPYPSNCTNMVANLGRDLQVFVADEGGSVVGWIAVTINASVEVAWVDHLMVTPERRRQGLGTALMQAAADYARSKRARSMMVPCSAKSSPAISFLRYLGMEFCGYNEHLYSDHQVAFIFAYHI